MSNPKRLVIGLFGFGVVGEGIYEVLRQTSSLNAVIKKICIRHPDKKRSADAHLLTTNYNDLLADDEINVIVELIDDAGEAFAIVKRALEGGKAVVSANKKMIAGHFDELLLLQKKFNTPLLYEAAVCGSIPIIRNLEEYYDNDLLQRVSGIVNGSTNFILTKVAEEGVSYKEALLTAQQSGFAESNPALDVEGTDAANKLCILLAHAYGIPVHPSAIFYKGITALHSSDMDYAKEKGYVIKLVAQSRKLANNDVIALVLPQFVTAQSQLYNVRNEFNGIELESRLSDKQFLYGKGAGRFPTASAVLSDLSALRYDYKYEYRKYNRAEKGKLTEDCFLQVYISFDNLSTIDLPAFEWIEEWYRREGRQHVTGVIQLQKLKKASWLASPGVSLVLTPDGIIEKEFVKIKSVKQKSLELAGIFSINDSLSN